MASTFEARSSGIEGEAAKLSDAEVTRKANRAILALRVTDLRKVALRAYLADPKIAEYIEEKHSARLTSGPGVQKSHLADPKIPENIDEKYAARPASAPDSEDRPRRFVSHPRKCWGALNTYVEDVRSGERHEGLIRVRAALDESTQMIKHEATTNTAWQTRKNALDVLGKMCKSVLIFGHVMYQKELIDDGVMLGSLMDTMIGIAKTLSEEEKQKYAGEGRLERIEQLKKLMLFPKSELPGLRPFLEVFGMMDIEEY